MDNLPTQFWEVTHFLAVAANELRWRIINRWTTEQYMDAQKLKKLEAIENPTEENLESIANLKLSIARCDAKIEEAQAKYKVTITGLAEQSKGVYTVQELWGLWHQEEL